MLIPGDGFACVPVATIVILHNVDAAVTVSRGMVFPKRAARCCAFEGRTECPAPLRFLRRHGSVRRVRFMRIGMAGATASLQQR